MKYSIIIILHPFILSFFLAGCKNDQLEEAIKGTYYNNNYKLEIKEDLGDHIRGGKSLFKTLTLYKWENEHDNFSKIEGPGYYEISGGRWEIEDGNLKLTFDDKNLDSKFWNFKIIPINFNPSAYKNWHNMHSCFILRGDKQNFFPEKISKVYHSD